MLLFCLWRHLQVCSPWSIKIFHLSAWTVAHCIEAHNAVRHLAFTDRIARPLLTEITEINTWMTFTKVTFPTKQPNSSGWCRRELFFLRKFHLKEIKDHFLFHQKPTPCSCVSLILHRLYRRVSMDTVWATSWIHTRLLSSVGAAVSHAGCCKSWTCSDNIICPFLARILLPFSVNCWNTSPYNGFGIQSWSFDTISDLTCSSSDRKHYSDFKRF